jgi:ribosomal protein S18 acetylase RimI-like enzyme
VGKLIARKAATKTWVRRLGPPDIAVLAWVARNNARYGAPGDRPPQQPLSEHDAKEFLSDERTVCLVAFEGHDPIGFLYANELYRRHGDLSHLCVYEIAVAEEYRGSGVGRQLFDALGAHAHKRGITQGFAITNTANRDAMQLFDKVGGQRGSDDDVVFAFRF